MLEDYPQEGSATVCGKRLIRTRSIDCQANVKIALFVSDTSGGKMYYKHTVKVYYGLIFFLFWLI